MQSTLYFTLSVSFKKWDVKKDSNVELTKIKARKYARSFKYKWMLDFEKIFLPENRTRSVKRRKRGNGFHLEFCITFYPTCCWSSWCFDFRCALRQMQYPCVTFHLFSRAHLLVTPTTLGQSSCTIRFPVSLLP